MRVDQFNYYLPKEYIAQSPASPRDCSRLLVYNKRAKKIIHDRFYNLTKYLRRGDVIVFNNTKVFPARLYGKKKTGGRLEVFLLKPLSGRTWKVLIGGKVRRPGMEIIFNRELRCVAIVQGEEGDWQVRFNRSFHRVLAIAEKIGTVPTPPYIKKTATRRQYQTVYAQKIGSVAAPTAGFHFTKRLLRKIERRGIQFEYVTLHVGYGTFQPVKERMIEKHHMHAEYAEVGATTMKRLIKAKQKGRRIVAIGTTTVRTLEAVFQPMRLKNSGRPPEKFEGWINIFIYPGYNFQFVDAIITNFHLPKSTLLMLIAAFIGRKKILDIYKKAIKKRYRFYSFGDGMLIF